MNLTRSCAYETLTVCDFQVISNAKFSFSFTQLHGTESRSPLFMVERVSSDHLNQDSGQPP